jgi:hypothetical protein
LISFSDSYAAGNDAAKWAAQRARILQEEKEKIMQGENPRTIQREPADSQQKSSERSVIIKPEPSEDMPLLGAAFPYKGGMRKFMEVCLKWYEVARKFFFWRSVCELMYMQSGMVLILQTVSVFLLSNGGTLAHIWQIIIERSLTFLMN